MADRDPAQLSQIRVAPGPSSGLGTAPAESLIRTDSDDRDAKTTGELVRELPSVTNRRLSGLHVDTRVRGYHSAQLNASADGMTERKTVQDLDSLFSQIDPGVVREMTVIDGPYSSLYGSGFAFLAGNLISPPRYADGPEAHISPFFNYGSNGQTLYNRENVTAGAEDWGMVFSYGLRTGNDYRSGGSHGFLVPSSYQKWDALFSFSRDIDPDSRIEFGFLRNEMNGVELPGVIYDLESSTNDQFNVRYVVQEDRSGPEQVVLQTWYHNTTFRGDALREEKQQTFYYPFLTIPYYTDNPINTNSRGDSNSLGVRGLRTFGEAESPQWTVGVDWRRYEQRYTERDLDSAGETVFGGNLYGIPRSRMDDIGALTNLTVPLSDRLTSTVGGRFDYAKPTLDKNDPVITEIADPDQWYYDPGLSEQGRALGMAYATGKYSLTDRCTVNFGTGFGTRMPELSELYSDETFLPFARFGNSVVGGLSTLKPERNWQFDLGITWKDDRAVYGVRGFYATVWDYIMPVPAYITWRAPNSVHSTHVFGRDLRYFPPEWREDLGTSGENGDACSAGYQYVNVEMATLFGGELFGEVRMLEWLSVYGSMGYVEGTNFRPVAFVYSDSGNYLVPIGQAEGLPGIYPLHGKLALRLVEPGSERWGLEFSTRMAAAQDHVARSLAEVPSAAFAVFDLRGYYQWRKRIRLTASLENLFNTYYSDPGSLAIIGPKGLPLFLPEPGISVGFGLEARF